MFSCLNLPAWSRATASRTKLSARQEARGETGGRKPSHTVRCFPSSGFLHFRQDDQFSGRLLVRKYTVHTCLYVCVYRAYTHAGKALSTSAWYPRICTCSTCPPSDRFILPNNGEFHWFGEIATFKKNTQHTFSFAQKRRTSAASVTADYHVITVYITFSYEGKNKQMKPPHVHQRWVSCMCKSLQTKLQPQNNDPHQHGQRGARVCVRYSHNRLPYPREVIHPNILFYMNVNRLQGTFVWV